MSTMERHKVTDNDLNTGLLVLAGRSVFLERLSQPRPPLMAFQPLSTFESFWTLGHQTVALCVSFESYGAKKQYQVPWCRCGRLLLHTRKHLTEKHKGKIVNQKCAKATGND